MAGTDYTEKQLAEHTERYATKRQLPENAVFTPGAKVPFRKATAEEQKSGRVVILRSAAGPVVPDATPAPATAKEGDQ